MLLRIVLACLETGGWPALVVHAGSEGWMMGQEAEDEKWIFLGGMGMGSRHCHKQTFLVLSRLFSKPMVRICMPTYDTPSDILGIMLQRCMPVPSQTRRNLHSHMRCALLDDATDRCVVFCHNDSAVIVSQEVTQLCADFPTEKLAKLEIYTFSAAAYEFVTPLGDTEMESDPTYQSTDQKSERRGVHVEHFAMTSDPFAQTGVLQSVRQNMDGLFCGSVFNMNDNNNMAPTSQESNRKLMMAPGPVAATTTRCSFLDSVLTVDRDCAEKREIAAMSNYHAASLAKKASGKRLSWTGLATMAAQRNGVNAGMVAFEMARKGCKSCEGNRGRDISWLVRYVAAEGKQATEVKAPS
ncbi:hypothetical protein N657DRAFT_661228 [Parathielavia appendiculata]|uniref:Uncharacterized protein n=1 Tax=Parathielavia appendiculata TaxID=2587402 RepID=A0AAN6Z5X4_9PEZI|nr:hypothetical protein N657DRAFT_661228 [Parathielavia appendiculata]